MQGPYRLRPSWRCQSCDYVLANCPEVASQATRAVYISSKKTALTMNFGVRDGGTGEGCLPIDLNLGGRYSVLAIVPEALHVRGHLLAADLAEARDVAVALKKQLLVHLSFLGRMSEHVVVRVHLRALGFHFQRLLDRNGSLLSLVPVPLNELVEPWRLQVLSRLLPMVRYLLSRRRELLDFGGRVELSESRDDPGRELVDGVLAQPSLKHVPHFGLQH